MKEIVRPTLTNLPQTPYSKYGDNFMEGQPNMPQSNPTPETPRITPERKQAVDNAWRNYNARRAMSGEIISRDELSTQEIIKNEGFMPPLTQEAQSLLEKVEQGGVPTTITQRLEKVLRDNGISEQDIATRKPEELINLLRENKYAKSFDRPSVEREDLSQMQTEGILDKKTKNLVERFNQENGLQSQVKIEEFKKELAKIGQELAKERTSKSEDTEAGKREIEQLEQKMGQVSDIAAQLEEQRRKISLSAEGQMSYEQMLVNKTEEFVNRLRERGRVSGVEPKKIKDIANEMTFLTSEEKIEREHLINAIKARIETTSDIHSATFRTELLMATRYFKELREELVSEVIFKSFEERSEMNQYEIEWYASSNLNILLGFMSRDDPQKYKEYLSLKTAAQFFHTMNSSILTGNFESYSRVAESISYRHFENMKNIRGSGLVMRLYEQKYKDYLAKDTRITEKDYEKLKGDVEALFRKMNEGGMVDSEYKAFRLKGDVNSGKMDDWEIKKALAAGRTFFNITLRGAENIATGQLPEDRKRYASFPQEDMVRMLNWNEWFLRRFEFGKAMHGTEFLEKVLTRYREFLRYKGDKLGVNAIVSFGGVNVKKMENGSQYRTSGVYSGWRLENMAFDKIKFKLAGKEGKISMKEFLDGKLEDTVLLQRLKSMGVTWNEEKGIRVLDALGELKDKVNAIQRTNPETSLESVDLTAEQELYRDILSPLINEVNGIKMGLSMLLKNSSTGGVGKIGYLFRQEVWKRVAATNTPLMIGYLTKLEYEQDAKTDKALSLEQIRANTTGFTDEKWELFKQKVLLRHERALKEAMGEEFPSLAKEAEYDADEQTLIREIAEQGKKLAPHLADIVFPYTPFMNDIPFEEIDYTEPGQTFYKRRTGGDLGGFNEGQKAFLGLMYNPGGLTAENAIKAMEGIIKGISGPEGLGVAMEANFCNLEALVDILETKKGLTRQGIVKMVMEATRNPTSIAQEWAGPQASSHVESELVSFLDRSVKEAIITPALEQYIRKKKKLQFSSILWMLFRDVFVLAPYFAGKEFVGDLMKEK